MARIRRRRQHRSSGIKGSFVIVGLGLVLVIILGYYLFDKLSEAKKVKEKEKQELSE